MKTQPTHIVCFGDSITQAGAQAEGDKWPNVLGQLLNEWRPGGFKVYNRGGGGHSSSQGVDRIMSDVVPLLPAVVLVEFGYNDAYMPPGVKVPRVGIEEFKVKLREIDRVVRAGKGRTVFLINHTQRSADKQGNGKSYTANYMPYDRAIRQVVRALRAPAIDLPTLMRRRCVDLDAFLVADGIHLSDEGNHLFADMVFGELKPLLA